jgi:hypothetical protein
VRRFLDILTRLCGYEIRWGSARMAILTKCYAIKIPRIDMGAEGFRSNSREHRKWAESSAAHLCPILSTLPFGMVIIMPRARPLTDSEFAELSAEYVAEAGQWSPPRLAGDFKRENFGFYDGKIVRIDYEGLAARSTAGA